VYVYVYFYVYRKYDTILFVYKHICTCMYVYVPCMLDALNLYNAGVNSGDPPDAFSLSVGRREGRTSSKEQVGVFYVHIKLHTNIHTYIHTCMHTYIHTYMHAYIHTYIHAYMHACTHIGRCAVSAPRVRCRQCKGHAGPPRRV